MNLERLRDYAILVAIVLVVTVLSSWLFTSLPFLAAMEASLSDHRVATLLPAEPQDEDIVVAAINEETLELFPYRSPIDRKFIADLLVLLEQRGARGILLDILFDQPTEEEKDELLRRTIADLRIPIAISYGQAAESLTEAQLEYLDEYVPLKLRGFANLVKDGFDDSVRTYYPGRKLADGSFLPGVASLLARELGFAEPAATADASAYRIAWHGQPDVETPAFRTYPSHAIKVLPAAWFKDKIVMIGADLSYTVGFSDRHRTPFSAGSGAPMPGVTIHAHVLSQLMKGRQAPTAGNPLIWSLIGALALVGMLLGRIEMPLWLRLAGGFVALALLWFGAFAWFSRGGPLVPLFSPTFALALSLWTTEVYTGRRERQQKKFIKSVFSKYVSADLIDEIIKDPDKLSLAAKRQPVSLIFTDVEGFTTLSEKIDPTLLSDTLNNYLDGACKEIFSRGGMVAQFTGDAIYAIFNAPRLQPDHAERALAAAIAIDRFAQAFVAEQVALGIPFGRTRIGVHTADSVVGNFGSRDRFEFKALGDAVNTASRLEGLNKYFGTHLLISRLTREASPDLHYRPIGDIVMKGKSEALPIFEPISEEEANSPYIKTYMAAFGHLARNESEAALGLFRQLLAERPKDKCVAFHIKRLEEGATGLRVVMEDK